MVGEAHARCWLFAFLESAVVLENRLCLFLSQTERKWRRKGTLHLLDARTIYLSPYPVSSLSLLFLWRRCHCTYQKPVLTLSIWIPVSFTFSRSLSRQLYLHFYYHTNMLSYLLLKKLISCFPPATTPFFPFTQNLELFVWNHYSQFLTSIVFSTDLIGFSPYCSARAAFVRLTLP